MELRKRGKKERGFLEGQSRRTKSTKKATEKNPAFQGADKVEGLNTSGSVMFSTEDTHCYDAGC